MVKPLMHDPIFLAGKSEPATEADLPVAGDLLDTLMAHRKDCVGMAANMIGVKKCIIVFFDGEQGVTMFNPQILRKTDAFRTEEGCLSLPGGPRQTTRYRSIKVRYQTADFRIHTKNFSGWTAQIIQHEVDHCNGILI